MNFFQQVTKPSQGSQETLEKKHVAWNSGLKVGPLTQEHRAKISETIKGKTKGKTKRKWSLESRAKFSVVRTRPVMTPYGVFPSIRAIAEASDRDVSTVGVWLRKFPEHYYYITKGE